METKTKSQTTELNTEQDDKSVLGFMSEYKICKTRHCLKLIKNYLVMFLPAMYTFHHSLPVLYSFFLFYRCPKACHQYPQDILKK